MKLPLPITSRIGRTADARGWFLEVVRIQSLQNGPFRHFFPAQVNVSKSLKGTFRGLHTKISGHEEAKMLWVLEGSLLDICLDTRPNSPGRGSFLEFMLEAESQNFIYIPEGYAHGFFATSDALVLYLTSREYEPDAEVTIKYDVSSLQRRFNIPHIIRSPKDEGAQTWEHLCGDVL